MTSPTSEAPTPEPQRPRRGRPQGRFKYSKRFVKASGATRALKASIEVYKDDVAAKVGERLAREKRQARAEGRLEKARAALSTVKSSLLGWISRRAA